MGKQEASLRSPKWSVSLFATNFFLTTSLSTVALGVATGLRSSIHGDLVDKVSFDEAGRMTALRLPAAGNLWRTQSYYPWTVKRNGGMLESLKVGLSEGGGERLSRSYAYNSFGDITRSYRGYDELHVRLRRAGSADQRVWQDVQLRRGQPADLLQRAGVQLLRLRAVPCGRPHQRLRPLRL